MTSSPHPGGLIHRPGVGAIWQTARWPSNQWLLLSHSENHTSPQVSQVVIFVAEWQSKKMDPRFPVGQARLETLGVLLCALIMALASCQVWNCVELILLGVNPPGSPPLLSASRRASLRPHHGGRLRPGVENVWTLTCQVCESPSPSLPHAHPRLLCALLMALASCQVGLIPDIVCESIAISLPGRLSPLTPCPFPIPPLTCSSPVLLMVVALCSGSSWSRSWPLCSLPCTTLYGRLSDRLPQTTCPLLKL